MRFQFWSMSEGSRVGILLRGSSVQVCLVDLNQGCCGCDTTYLIGCCDLMLTQPWIKVMYCSLLWLTLHIRAGTNISHLSIPGKVTNGRRYISLFFPFFLTVCRVVLVFFKCVINLTSFLFKYRFFSFPICGSAHLLSHYYYCYNYYCYYYLLLIYIYIYIYIYTYFFLCFVLLLFLIFIV